MKKVFFMLLAVVLLVSAYSCSDNNIGSSISETQVEVVKDSSFTVSGVSLRNSDLPSRTITQLLGKIKATNYGELETDVVTQFMPAAVIDTAGVKEEYIDSCAFVFQIPLGGYTGDSIAALRTSIYTLDKQLPSDIKSSFIPSGYYSAKDLIGSTAYTASAIMERSTFVEDTLDVDNYRQFKVKVPRSMALDLFRKYKEDPSVFQTPTAFANYFPGVYVANTFGSGRVMNIFNTEFQVSYRKYVQLTDTTDTIYHRVQSYMGATPEILSNNNIKLKVAKNVEDMVASGDAIVQSPAGYEVSLKFPIQDVIDNFLNGESKSLSVVNNLYFEIPVEELQNEYGIKPPLYLLLVKASEKDEFFSKTNVVDNISSFYAAYDSTNKKYIFSEMRDYVLDIINNHNGIAQEEDVDFILTPVDMTTETTGSSYYSSGTTTITGVKPAIYTPAIGKLLFSKAKIKLIYTRQSQIYD